MTGIDRVYCNVAIRALLEANYLLKGTTIEELLRSTQYGKTDTLTLDALPEIVIKNQLAEFDPDLIFLTEELGQTKGLDVPQEIPLQPVVFIADPTDRSSFLKAFLVGLDKAQSAQTLGEVVCQKTIVEAWEEQAGAPATISGATSALSGVKKGVPFFSVILNYITQELFVACDLGARRVTIRGLPPAIFERLTLQEIFKDSEEIFFGFPRQWQDVGSYKKFFSFLGKTGYRETLESADIFLSNPEEHLVYGEPGGPARILYLSQLYQENPVGFILANGEKIIEWIHWLSYIAATQKDENALCAFEISFEKPWTKDGILMATSPAYSAFVWDAQKECHLVNLAKIKDHPNPSRYRSTLLVTFRENKWAISTMEKHSYRELKFSF